jgi:hypothetical protein
VCQAQEKVIGVEALGVIETVAVMRLHGITVMPHEAKRQETNEKGRLKTVLSEGGE